jgi:hypothetical protein
MTELESAALVTELAMDTKSQFYALEVMCRERAAVARRDMEYWLNEAEEWAQLRKADHPSPGGRASIPRKFRAVCNMIVAALMCRGSLAALLRV